MVSSQNLADMAYEAICAGDWERWRKAEEKAIESNGINLSGRKFQRCSLEGNTFRRIDFRGADFSHANLVGCNFAECDMRGANLHLARLTDTHWRETRIDHKTQLDRLRFDPTHDSISDDSDQVRLPPLDRILNWSRLRAIGRFPIFNVSWASLGLTLLVILGIGWLNDTEVPQRYLGLQRFEVPPRTVLALIGSLLLVFGSTLFHIACPIRVQEFSEAQWVEEHGHPRLLYLASSLPGKMAQATTAILTLSGGGIAIYLLGEYVVRAIRVLL